MRIDGMIQSCFIVLRIVDALWNGEYKQVYARIVSYAEHKYPFQNIIYNSLGLFSSFDGKIIRFVGVKSADEIHQTAMRP